MAHRSRSIYLQIYKLGNTSNRGKLRRSIQTNNHNRTERCIFSIYEIKLILNNVPYKVPYTTIFSSDTGSRPQRYLDIFLFFSSNRSVCTGTVPLEDSVLVGPHLRRYTPKRCKLDTYIPFPVSSAIFPIPSVPQRLRLVPIWEPTTHGVVFLYFPTHTRAHP